MISNFAAKNNVITKNKIVMKKIFLLMATLLVMGSTAFAGDGLDYCIGPKIGYQTARLSYAKADIKAGFLNNLTFGLFGRVSYNRLYVQPEIMYFRTENIFSLDTKNNVAGLNSEERVTFTLNESTLQVPILFGFKLIDRRLVSLRVQMGPTANFILASKTLFDKNYSLTNLQGENVEIEDDENAFDTKSIAWGMQAGIGIDVLNRITLDINYNFGMSKIFGEVKNSKLNEYFDFNNIDKTRQNMFMVTLGVKFL